MEAPVAVLSAVVTVEPQIVALESSPSPVCLVNTKHPSDDDVSADFLEPRTVPPTTPIRFETGREGRDMKNISLILAENSQLFRLNLMITLRSITMRSVAPDAVAHSRGSCDAPAAVDHSRGS